MSTTMQELQIGDVIEVKYREWKDIAAVNELGDCWIVAVIVHCEPGTWPLARLKDGQLTEIRPHMCWRLRDVSRLDPAIRQAA